MPLTPEQKNQIREIIRDELKGILIMSDRIVFKKDIEMSPGRDFIFSESANVADRTSIGKNTSNKVSFYGVDGTGQQTAPTYPGLITVSGSGADSSINTNFSRIESWIDDIIGVLRTIGITN